MISINASVINAIINNASVINTRVTNVIIINTEKVLIRTSIDNVLYILYYLQHLVQL